MVGARQESVRTALPRRPRTSERGAAIFIVVMVLTMLTAIGIFAARASSMSEAAAGFDRQNSQNHYTAEYGLLGAITELGTPKRNAYVQRMSSGTDRCAGTQGLENGDAGTAPPCYHLYASEIQGAVTLNGGGRQLFDPGGADAGTPIPGSLGTTALDGDFVVEMTDPGPASTPVAGADLAGVGSKFRYIQVTLTSTGQVRPRAADPALCDPNAARVAGNESARANVVVGPVQ